MPLKSHTARQKVKLFCPDCYQRTWHKRITVRRKNAWDNRIVVSCKCKVCNKVRTDKEGLLKFNDK